MSTPSEWQQRFVEQMGLHADIGMPRSVARVFGWLVVCQPRHQTARQLQDTLGMSAGSVSAATTTLVRAGIVARHSIAGDRRIYYQIHTDGWHRLLASRLRSVADVRAVAEQAIQGSGGARDERLVGMRDFFASAEAAFERLRARYDRPEPKPRKGSKKKKDRATPDATAPGPGRTREPKGAPPP